MKHVSYKDLSPDRYKKWSTAKVKMLKKFLRDPRLGDSQKQKILKRIEALSNKSLIE